MVGLLDHIDQRMTLAFRNDGDLIYLLGAPQNDVHCSEYLKLAHQISLSVAPWFDLEEEYALQQAVRQLILDKQIKSAHDVSEGGLMTTLMESAFVYNKGFAVNKSHSSIRSDAYWYGESQSRIVVSISADQQDAFESAVKKSGLPFAQLGQVTSGDILVDGNDWGNIDVWKAGYDSAIGNMIVAKN
jgi:phosphoribosylformylglycinamidine synthase